ncbi:enolase C-terminal domain-like protein [Granulicella tundricola]|uniref:L-fuconate dehydratase n=1 Tax=Granulicella tundricola (strain ATCC BAA-1859 / DSM 23138 / MP5ACTX9) TaxID=1198114 RepID=E8X717_GRATM|nr:enolase C-terminal domain-like protein [Granulicella tundricola]ADW71126.1 Mandelate racemase/muconate lactonizing protein [Granulicella tundricola MP5ACTX9]
MHSTTITQVRVIDLRFPTSRDHIGSDAVNVDPDYSAAYCILETDSGLEGHGLTFTLGRGTDLVVSAIQHISTGIRGRTLEELTRDLNALYLNLTGDTQFRWLGPEKGVIHLAVSAVLNAVWDLYAKSEGKPVWALLADMTPAEIVRCIDFRYISDALSVEDAIELLTRGKLGQSERLAQLEREGYPAYTTSVGWFGFSDDKIRTLCQQALSEGWTHFKLKVGGAEQDDLRRGHIVREQIGWTNKLMVDANQRWGVEEAIRRTRLLAELNPWWMEEPTSPDDILGHARIRQESGVRIATGEHCHNAVMFKQLLQAEAIDVCQIDSCRVASVNENLAILLMAAKFGVPVCPHAGGVGLCEYVQHLSVFDFLSVSCSLENRVIEYVDHLHEHFVAPVAIRRGHYLLPKAPGYSAQILPASLAEFSFPYGQTWQASSEQNGKVDEVHIIHA